MNLKLNYRRASLLKLERVSMKPGQAVVVIFFATTSVFAKDQTATPANFDAQKIVRSIIGDMAKIKAYCELAKLS